MPSQGEIIAQRYRLDRQIGAGGMGEVWAATQTITRRPVAMKFLLPALLSHEHVRERFLTEARAATSIDHPAVVHVIDVFELDDRSPVIVMERLDGESLREALERHEIIEVNATLALLAPVADALRAAHEAGVIHRDLKPENIFLNRDKRAAFAPRVIDFGIAKLLEDDEAGSQTRTGVTLGTPCYMSPEQASAEQNLDARVDIWALGVVLYECLSGVRPVEANSQGELVKRLILDAITPLAVLAPEVPPAVAELVDRMLSCERDDRPADMSEVVAVLEAAAADLPAVEVWDFPESSSEDPSLQTTVLPVPVTELADMPPQITPLDLSVVDPPFRLSRAAILLGVVVAVMVAAGGAITMSPSSAAAPKHVEPTATPSSPPTSLPPAEAEIEDDPVVEPARPDTAATATVATPSKRLPKPSGKPPWCNTREGFEVVDDQGTLRLRAECQ